MSYLESQRALSISEELVQQLHKKRSKQGYVFLTYYGEAFTKCKLGRAETEFKVKGNFSKNWCCSDFRHSFSVHFLSIGGSLNKLQYILGHSNVHQTKQLYGEVRKRILSKNSKNSFDPYTSTAS
ncbi:MAG: tyrosine-type recombinase/integrase [Bacteriovoracia bacterium]